MDTYFASPERSTPGELFRHVYQSSNNPVINGLLTTVSGLLAVLNEHRQILAVNNTLLDMLGIEDPKSVLGLRPGEAIGCIHAHEMPGGCGTSRYCSTCGAAIAIVTSLSTMRVQEQICMARVTRDGRETDLCLRVRACPIDLEGSRCILLFIQDISREERWASLERAFFHDISNTITALQGAGELMDYRDGVGQRELARQMSTIAHHLAKEVEVQRTLCESGSHAYQVETRYFTTADVTQELRSIFTGHRAAQERMLEIREPGEALPLNSDIHLVQRILVNMLVNAFEATPKGGSVRLLVHNEQGVTFSVWSAQAMPPEVAGRVFQRHFSTKGIHGRGIGTFAMKLFGEEMLGGTVDFSTSEAEGTTFRLRLPAAFGSS